MSRVVVARFGVLLCKYLPRTTARAAKPPLASSRAACRGTHSRSPPRVAPTPPRIRFCTRYRACPGVCISPSAVETNTPTHTCTYLPHPLSSHTHRPQQPAGSRDTATMPVQSSAGLVIIGGLFCLGGTALHALAWDNEQYGPNKVQHTCHLHALATRASQPASTHPPLALSPAFPWSPPNSSRSSPLQTFRNRDWVRYMGQNPLSGTTHVVRAKQNAHRPTHGSRARRT